MKKKVAVLGSGNSACLTALQFHSFLYSKIPAEIVIYPTEENCLESIRQSCDPITLDLISQSLDINYYSNDLDFTLNSGFLYKNWSKNEIFNPYSISMNTVGVHYSGKKLFDSIVKSKYFTIKDETIKDPEKDIDCDVIFDCRNGYDRDKSKYKPVQSIVNSILLCNKEGMDLTLNYTSFVATPYGWVFIIPDVDSVQYGYVYNNTITPKEDIIKDFLERFNLSQIDDDFTFESYKRDEIMVGDKTILNGFMHTSFEPLDTRNFEIYEIVCRQILDFLINGNYNSKRLIDNINAREKFIAWHYQFGSEYDTDFWRMGKKLPFTIDDDWMDIIQHTQWGKHNFEKWAVGVGYNNGKDVIETMRNELNTN